MPKPDSEVVNIYDAKTRFSRLINEVESGKQITISRNGRPVALLVPFRARRPTRAPGVWAGKVTIDDDFDAFTADDEHVWYGV